MIRLFCPENDLFYDVMNPPALAGGFFSWTFLALNYCK